MKRRTIVWKGELGTSLERCTLISSAVGFELSGVIIQVVRQDAYVVTYAVELDHSWATRTVRLDLQNGTQGTVSLVRDGDGRWARNGRDAPELDGCADVDIEWTPATNTLPIRRLQLGVGESRPVTAAWIRCPSLAVERLGQTYERVDRDHYRYRAGDFIADLEADADGLVRRYGGGWTAVGNRGKVVG